MSDTEAVAQLGQIRDRIYGEIGQVVIGQKQIVEELLIALLAGGHCLLVGVPGLAKTTLIQTLARTLDLSFGRIQFTPDLMPSDITGTEVLEEDIDTGRKAFSLHPRGPLFRQRHPRRRNQPHASQDPSGPAPSHAGTRSHRGWRDHAAQRAPSSCSPPKNPIEQEGTYPLPEAQLDRFIFELWIDYPSDREEEDIVRATTSVAQATVKPSSRCRADHRNYNNSCGGCP